MVKERVADKKARTVGYTRYKVEWIMEGEKIGVTFHNEEAALDFAAEKGSHPAVRTVLVTEITERIVDWRNGQGY